MNKMTKTELISLNIDLQNEIHRLKKELPNVKTDEYIKRYRNKVEPFKFTYAGPYLDWVKPINVVINYDDYYCFKLERRYGSSWWLVGLHAYDRPKYHWKETSIGEINIYDLKRFIEWAKSLENNGGNSIVQVSVLSNSFDIFKAIKELEDDGNN